MVGQNDELACVYASLILADDKVPITGEKISAILKAAGYEVEPYWPGLFANALEGVKVTDLISNLGAGAAAAPAAAAAAPAAAKGGAAAPAAKKEEPKKEEKKKEEEEDDDEDHVRSKHPSNVGRGGGNPNNANRAHSGVDRNRSQSKNKPTTTNYERPNNRKDPDEDGDDEDDDDDIQFTSGGAATPRSEVKPSKPATPTASSAPPADSTQQVLSPNKAVTSYLVPIVVMWIGNWF